MEISFKPSLSDGLPDIHAATVFHGGQAQRKAQEHNHGPPRRASRILQGIQGRQDLAETPTGHDSIRSNR
ncbi:hypothetical protein E2C01_098030 [Portunus trituberculatus]|uniref:Uncharacterized protein n=1 Tax=Portunus trituberculatus TaxID=210409 RepID=A0A5B7K6G2_PORTR|nr:hypothetical protein [Portunus trituberculatus]